MNGSVKTFSSPWRTVCTVLLLCSLLASCAASTNARLQEQLDLGAKYVSELDYEQALLAYTAAIELDPKNSDLYVARGGVYTALERYEDAAGDYTQAIALNDQNAPAYVARGDVYLLLLDYTGAVLDFDSAAALGEDVDQRLDNAIRMGMELERAQGGISAVLHWLETIHRQALDVYQELALQAASLEALQAACASGDDEAVFALLKQIDEQGTFDELSGGEGEVRQRDQATQRCRFGSRIHRNSIAIRVIEFTTERQMAMKCTERENNIFGM